MKILILTVMVILLTGCGYVGDKFINDVFLEEVEPWSNETFVPDGYNLVTSNSMVVYGNSISLIPDAGYGMSASSIDTDYVHVLANLISVNVTVRNCWDIEKDYRTFDFSGLPTDNLVIIQLGDNLMDDVSRYRYHLSRMVDHFQGCDVILLSTILKSPNGNKAVNNQIKAVAIQYNIPFIDARNAMWLSDEHTGGSRHPSDSAMAAIANMIYNKIN